MAYGWRCDYAERLAVDRAVGGRERVQRGSVTLKKKRELYSDVATSIDADNNRKEGSYGGGSGGGS